MNSVKTQQVVLGGPILLSNSSLYMSVVVNAIPCDA